MRVLVVYDSLYGNTRTIAQAIACAMPGVVALLHVDDVNLSDLSNYDLLVIGAPTHGGRPSPPAQALLKQLEAPHLAGARVAAFDTRLPTRWLRLFGYAAPRIARRLEKMDVHVVAAEGFFVAGTEGPLKEGEVERAATWAREIATLVDRTATPVA